MFSQGLQDLHASEIELKKKVEETSIIISRALDDERSRFDPSFNDELQRIDRWVIYISSILSKLMCGDRLVH